MAMLDSVIENINDSMNFRKMFKTVIFSQTMEIDQSMNEWFVTNADMKNKIMTMGKAYTVFLMSPHQNFIQFIILFTPGEVIIDSFRQICISEIIATSVDI